MSYPGELRARRIHTGATAGPGRNLGLGFTGFTRFKAFWGLVDLDFWCFRRLELVRFQGLRLTRFHALSVYQVGGADGLQGV